VRGRFFSWSERPDVQPRLHHGSSGGVLQRYKDLIAKKHAVTMLIAPFDVMAQASGVNVLRKV